MNPSACSCSRRTLTANEIRNSDVTTADLVCENYLKMMLANIMGCCGSNCIMHTDYCLHVVVTVAAVTFLSGHANECTPSRKCRPPDF